MGNQGENRERSPIPGDDLTGRTLGEFILREKIGEGGFGAVYSAYQGTLSRDAAVKVLHARHLGSDEMVERFVREARLASRFDHPYAAHIYAFGVEDDGVLWIAMELVRGTPLGELLAERGPIALERLVPLVERIAEVVDSAHEQGIIHRDIKPANVMVLSRAGRLFPKLLDLGIARLAETTASDARSVDTVDDLPVDLATSILDGGDTVVVTSGEREFLSTVTAHLAEASSSKLIETVGHVTAHGTIIGSPAYMAPELWRKQPASAKSDIYALGVLTYEALTGQRPFVVERTATTTADHTPSPPAFGQAAESMAEKHADAPVPPLGPSFSPALDGAVAMAMAKHPAKRYESALDFAAALRRAAGLTQTVEKIPALPEEIREVVIAKGPQPIAESLAVLDAARSRTAASEAVSAAAAAVVRYLGAIALASRARISSPGGDTREAIELARRLRRTALTDADWLNLVIELCRPFWNTPEAHPVPELVTFIFATDGELQPATESLTGLLAAAGGDLDQQVADVARCLRAMTQLFGYTLVVTDDDGADDWTGLRRTWRVSVPLGKSAVKPDSVLLVDRDGAIALVLSPIVQALAPTPGTNRELFFLSGKGRFGAKMLAIPIGFERQDPKLWKWFDGVITSAATSASEASESERAPYRGLASFTASDASLFFGREREAEAFANRLRTQPLIAVVGPSGVGKSSFVHAGVVPLLSEDSKTISFRPGPNPFDALSRALLAANVGAASRAAAKRDVGGLAESLAGFADDADLTLILVVDQFEELLTVCSDPQEAEMFAEALVLAAQETECPVRVVLTLRDDFLIRCQGLAPLRDRLGQGLQLLSTPEPADLRRILVEPARCSGYELEDNELADAMVSAVADQPGALALLSFTASKLWELRDRTFRRLTRKAYDALGGVGGALAQHAEHVLERLGEGELDLVREAFRHLVTADGTRAILSRAELHQILGGGADAEDVMQRLVDARLLVVSEAIDAEDRIEIIHETLLSSWPRLVNWQREDAENARLRDQIRAAARQWEQRDRDAGLLWRGEALVEYQLWRRRYRGSLTTSEEDFANASVADDLRAKRRRRAALIAAFVILCVGLVVLFQMNRRAERNAVRAENNADQARINAEAARRSTEAMYIEQGRLRLLDNRSLEALPYLAAAYRGADSAPPLPFLVASAVGALDQMGPTLAEHADWVRALDTSKDGTRLISGSDDKSATLWDLERNQLLATLAHEDKVRAVAFSPFGKHLATASVAGKIHLWRAGDGQRVVSLAGHQGAISNLRFTGDGSQLLSTDRNGLAKLWEVPSGKLVASLEGHRGPIFAAELSNGSIATAGADRIVRLWTRQGTLVASLIGHDSAVIALDFSADGSRLVSGGADNVAMVWDVAAKKQSGILTGHAGPVRAVAVTAAGDQAITASEDGSARVWNLESMRPTQVLNGHRGVVVSVRIDAEGRRAITASADATAIVWDLHSGKPIQVLEGHRGEVWDARFANAETIATASYDGTVRAWKSRAARMTIIAPDSPHEARSVAFASNGKSLVTAGSDGKVRLLDTATGAVTRRIEVSKGELWSADFSPDGDRIVAAAADGTATILASGGQEIHRLKGHEGSVNRAMFSRDGKMVLTIGDDGTARLWDAKSGASLRVIAAHQAGVWGATFSRDGKRIATGADDRTAAIWDLASGELVRRFETSASVNTVELGNDGKRLAAAGEDGRVRIWDTDSGVEVVAFEGHTANVTQASLSFDGQRLATASFDGSARIWDVDGGRLLATLEAHRDILFGARFSPTGESLATVGADGRVVLWRLPLASVSVADLEELMGCRIPHALDDGRLVPSTPCPPKP